MSSETKKENKMEEYVSTIVVKFSINNHEARSKKDYIEIIKSQFNEQYGINLMDKEITKIKRIKNA